MNGLQKATAGVEVLEFGRELQISSAQE